MSISGSYQRQLIFWRTSHVLKPPGRAFWLLILATFILDSFATPGAHANDRARQILQELLQGNLRHQSGQTLHGCSSAFDSKEGAPEVPAPTVILGCMDRRVVPERVFDSTPDSVFAVRTAGQSLSSAVIGSIELAVKLPDTRLIVVMGHTDCAAIKSSIASYGYPELESEDLGSIYKGINARLQAANLSLTATPDHREEGIANAIGVANELVAHSRLIREAVQSKRVLLVVALYDVRTKQVTLQTEIQL